MTRHRFPELLALITAAIVVALPSALAHARDCNGNGRDDEEEIAAGAREDCNGDGIPDECQPVPLQFSTVPSSVGPGVPAGLAAGDFDGDGLEDLASASPGRTGEEGTITVFLARAGGEFSEATQSIGLLRPNTLRAGDLDLDGDQDLALVTTDGLWVVDGNGDGTFGAAREIDSTRRTSRLEVEDVNGDGAPDLITKWGAKDLLYVYINDGQGRYGEPREYAVGRLPNAIAAGDLDGDGDLDIAVAGRRSDSLSLLVNDEGAFTVALVDTVDPNPREIAFRDLNDDGLADLAVGSYTALNVLFSNGDGTFEPVARFALSKHEAAAEVVAADIDGDRDVDLLMAVYTLDGLVVILNGGDGSFVRLPPIGLTERPSNLLVGDWNLDGRADVAATLEAASVVGLLVGGGATEFTRFKSSVPALGEPHGGAMGDLDGDGDLDIVTSNGNCNTVSLLTNDGSGQLTARIIDRIRGFLHSMAADDFDRDGDLDLVIADLSGGVLHTRANDGQGAFGQNQSYITRASPFYVTTGDLNGDGYPEILTANDQNRTVTLLFNQGEQPDGTFRFAGLTPDAPWEVVRVGIGAVGVAAGDFDSDGSVDLAVANHGSSELTVHSGDGAGAFSDPDVYDVSTPRFVATLDFDGDGHPDLATVDEAPRQVSVFPNQGDGTFAPPLAYPLGQMPYSLIAVDLTGDGTVDIVTANQNPDSASVLLNPGDGTFSPPFLIKVGIDPRFVLSGDLDGDGVIDLATTNHTSMDLTLLLSAGVAGGNDPFLETVCTGFDFFTVSIPSGRQGPVERLTKYIVPADRDDPELLPPLFQNVERFPLHQEFLAALFSDRFPVQSYEELVGRRATRRYFIGVLNLLRTDDGPLYGFTVVTSFQSDPAELPRVDEVRAVYETLSEVFTLRPLAYAPDALATEEDARTWGDPGFPVFLGAAGPTFEYEAYTRGIAYGFVRRRSQGDFEAANDSGLVSAQDILVLERAPRDIEGVVSGVITGEVQGALGHLAIRTSRRGTPNAFVEDALDEFAPYEGQLVRLEVRESDYLVEPATPAAARAWWDAHRPRLPELPGIDGEFAELSTLEEIDALEGDGAPPLEARFGGKASHFARLQAALTGEWGRYRESGFAVPLRHYLEFMESNRIRSVVDPPRLVTYAEFIRELADDEEFSRSSTYRFRTLEGLREHMRDRGVVPADLVQAIAIRIGEVFGSTTERVRFRSSSNVEDALEFNGAGLYDSTSACAADDLDLDARGPSRCDASRDEERGIARALKRVWSSLWNFRAFEERAFFGIPVDRAAMGVLVTRSFPDERANGVAFTGSPSSPLDRRYVVSAQVGDRSVVRPEPGEIPEKDLVWMEDGELVAIERTVPSSLVAAGEVVLTDGELEELGRLLSHIDQSFPVDLGEHSREQVLLDVEFKFDADGRLAVKQVRPFLLSTPVPPSPTFALEIPPATTLCGVFVPFRRLREAFEAKSTLEFSVRAIELPTRSAWFRGQLFDGLRLGPEKTTAAAGGPGIFHVTRLPRGERTVYRFDYEQELTLATGEAFTLRLANLRFAAVGDAPIERTLVIDEEFVTRSLTLEGNSGTVTYSSCTYETLPLWEVEVSLEGGSFIRLLERHELPPTVNDTGPASLVRAEVSLAGVERTVTDYWRLVYAADRHNLNVRYWVVFEEPLEIPGHERPVAILEVRAPEPSLGVTEEVHYLDASFQVIESPAILAWERGGIEEPRAMPFRRGDFNGDRDVDLTDAVALLDHLFRGESTTCAKAGDANDDGATNLSDAVAILAHLVGGAGPLPPPFGECGLDPTPDELPCERNGVCGR